MHGEPSQYNSYAEFIHREEEAAGVVVIVIGGTKNGHGMAYVGEDVINRVLPSILRDLANGIEEVHRAADAKNRESQ